MHSWLRLKLVWNSSKGHMRERYDVFTTMFMFMLYLGTYIQPTHKQCNLLGLSMSVYMQKTKLNLWVIITTVQYPFRNSSFTVVSLHHKQQKFGRIFKFGKSVFLNFTIPPSIPSRTVCWLQIYTLKLFSLIVQYEYGSVMCILDNVCIVPSDGWHPAKASVGCEAVDWAAYTTPVRAGYYTVQVTTSYSTG